MANRGSRNQIPPPFSSPEVVPLDGPTSQSRKRKRSSDSGTSRTQAAAAESSAKQPVVIEDIEEGDVLDLTLQKQREEQVASQKNVEDQPANLMQGICSICLDDFETLVAAKCGHVFCQICLEHSLRASERRQVDARKAQCPSCRKAIVRKKAKEVVQIKFIDREKFEGQKENKMRREQAIFGGDVGA